MTYKLLTPGPLTTTESVKQAMMTDHCTWDEDYKQITRKIQKQLLDLAQADPAEYAAVLMQGSGTFGVEAVLTSAVGEQDKVLIVANGAYGNRIKEIAQYSMIPHSFYCQADNKIPCAEEIGTVLDKDETITHVAMVHGETTSGILNDIQAVAKVVKGKGRTFIVDAMSTFGGIEIAVQDLAIDFIVSSANKCIQGVPGFSFIIAKRQQLESCKGKGKSLSLDLYGQYLTMETDGKWRFTSPTHVVLAFSKALDELEEEGGVAARYNRYANNNRLLIEKMKAMGMKPYIDQTVQGPVITAFYYPEDSTFAFQDMYRYIKERGYAIYPGKVTEADTFRIGNIGEIYEEDIEKLTGIMNEFLKECKNV